MFLYRLGRCTTKELSTLSRTVPAFAFAEFEWFSASALLSARFAVSIMCSFGDDCRCGCGGVWFASDCVIIVVQEVVCHLDCRELVRAEFVIGIVEKRDELIDRVDDDVARRRDDLILADGVVALHTLAAVICALARRDARSLRVRLFVDRRGRVYYRCRNRIALRLLAPPMTSDTAASARTLRSLIHSRRV